MSELYEGVLDVNTARVFTPALGAGGSVEAALKDLAASAISAGSAITCYDARGGVLPCCSRRKRSPIA